MNHAEDTLVFIGTGLAKVTGWVALDPALSLFYLMKERSHIADQMLPSLSWGKWSVECRA